MSTKKRTVRVSTTTSSSFAEGDSSFNNSSVLETSRAQEKEQLLGLNSRLAVYIDKVRQLENENRRLQVQIRDVEVIEKKERNNIADKFEAEKRRLRALIDDLEKREAKAAIERDTAVAEHDRLLARVAKLERDLAKADDERMGAVAAADEALAKQRTIQSRFDKAETELKDVTRERNRLASQLASLQKTLEDEVLQKTVAQNEIARLTEDLAFLKDQHESALEEVKHKRQVDMTTYQKQVTQEYQSKLQDQLAEMRAQFQDQRSQINSAIEERYKNKLNEAQEARDFAITESAKLRSRVRELEVSEGQNSRLLDALRHEVDELKQQMADRLADKDARISDLNKEISRLLAEFNNLLDIKIQLDAELNTYRLLLEGEEERLNLTNEEAGRVVTHHASFRSGTGSASRGIKRRRVENGDDETNFDYHRLKQRMQKETTGPVGIDEVDEEGNWVRILNSSEDEVNIAKWALIARAGGVEIAYRFSNKMRLAPGATFTVYSANSGQKNVTDGVVMKSQSWPVGENPSARLEDHEGDVVSTITLEASESTDPSDPQDRCNIM